MRLAVLASGTGSICQAIIDAHVDVAAIVADRTCGVIDLANARGIPSFIVERTDFGSDFDRRQFSRDIVTTLQEADIDVIAMAGFGTVLDAPFFDAFDGRVLNTHPALLPSFPGWHGVRDALREGVKITGCTVHIATLEVDSGPILAQAAVEVLDNDDEASLHERIKSTERHLYPATIKKFLADLEAHT